MIGLLPRLDEELPEFSQPPVAEVALGVQFTQTPSLRLEHYGLLWSALADRFPGGSTDLAPPLPRWRVPLAQPEWEFAFGIGVQMPRFQVRSATGDAMIQLQPDRLIQNWARRERVYPRYRTLRTQFEELAGRYCSLSEEWGLGDWSPDICELTYVNELDPEVGLDDLRFALAEHHPSDVRLGLVLAVLDEQARAAVGNLEIVVEKRHFEGARLGLALRLTARIDVSEIQLLRGLDIAHDVIVRKFTDVTTQDAHRRWVRTR